MIGKIDYKMISKAVFFPKEKILAISDLHVGYEEALNKSGILIPHSQFKQTISDLDEIFMKIKKEKWEVREVVILGDLNMSLERYLGRSGTRHLEFWIISRKRNVR
jgi:metallophosphoesterase superfamily enzyme